MDLPGDNVKGLVLAVSSSIFIGSSFIIKKRGLRVAGTHGVRAGAPDPETHHPHAGALIEPHATSRV